MYYGASAYIATNSAASASFQLRRGVRQGCPLSAALFSLYTEPLIQAIQQNSAIRGFIPMNEKVQWKIVAFADDIYLTLSDADSVREALHIVKQFADVTGCRFNRQKTKTALWGRWRKSEIPRCDLDWPSDGMKVLGLHIWPAKSSLRQAHTYWNDVMKSTREITRSWNTRNLSIFGKTAVWNSMILSRLWYRVPFLSISSSAIKKIERIGALFIWGSACYEPLRRLTLKAPIKRAGLGMVDIRLKIIEKYLHYFYDAVKGNYSWSDTAYCMLAPFLRQYFPAVITEHQPPMTQMHSVLLRIIEALPSQFIQDMLNHDSWKPIYSKLVDYAIPVPRIVELHGSLPGHATQTLRRIRIDPLCKTVGWKIVHGILPLLDWLYQRGLPPHYCQCQACGVPETLDHFLTDCVDTRGIWAYITSNVNINVLSTQQKRFLEGFTHICNDAKWVLFANTASWLSRNVRVFEKKQSDATMLLITRWHSQILDLL